MRIFWDSVGRMHTERVLPFTHCVVYIHGTQLNQHAHGLYYTVYAHNNLPEAHSSVGLRSHTEHYLPTARLEANSRFEPANLGARGQHANH